MPLSKQQLDKNAWQWAEHVAPEDITDEHLVMSYRLDLLPCSGDKYRRNCKGNPRCLVGLGEKEWLQQMDEDKWHDVEDAEGERREEGDFVGLKNLGATCYVNTLLQVWFHNKKFRSTIYEWCDRKWLNGTDTKQADESDALEYKPSNVCGHLQLLFALMQFSNRQYIDPSSFVTSLGLVKDQQQDAQEFSKLLMSLLEDTLSDQAQSHVRNLIQDQFCGEYAYVTECNSCHNESHRPSKFYELDLNIKDHRDLHSSIKEFLEEEKLEGDNQYMCAYCNSKQNAIRRIKLTRPPTVLNIQLLRFLFDRKSGHKKKLNSYIEFPEELDISVYLNADPGMYIYELYAVLIHSGPSAYSGHYVAHIKDRKKDTWYKFNDEEIEEMKGKKLNLGNEDTTISSGAKSGVKVPKVTKGSHSSRNAYMLVYQQKRIQQDTPEAHLFTLPQHIQQHVNSDNKKLDNWILEMDVMKKENIINGRVLQDEMKMLYQALPTKPDEDLDWIPTSWLIEWMTSSKEKKEQINNSSYLCSHNRLNPDQVTKMKCIHRDTADILYSKFGGGPRLHRDAICSDCVQTRCKKIQIQTAVGRDSKVISMLTSSPYTGNDGFWVGKSSLRSWKRLVMEKLDQSPTEDGHSNDNKVESAICDSAPIGVSENEKPVPEISSNTEFTTTDEDDVSLSFNEDVLCELHDNLSVSEHCRRLVPPDAWLCFRRYFPEAREFSALASPCDKCIALNEEESSIKMHLKKIAEEQKTILHDLYHDRNRPVWKKGIQSVYIVQREWLDQWRKYIKLPNKDSPGVINNELLICCHSNCLLEPDIIGVQGVQDSIVPVWPLEWNFLKNTYGATREIQVTRVAEDSPPVYLCEPSVCEECMTKRQLAAEKQRWQYKEAKVYIRKLMTGSKFPGEDSADSGEFEDSEFLQKNGKRKTDNTGESTTDKVMKLDNAAAAIRRSGRHRKVRGEKEVVVSSDNTLRDLKLKIMRLFSVAPFDQNLSLGGRSLTGDQEKLGQLHVGPGDVVFLQADEPCDDPMLMEDLSQSKCPEEGFKGTSLLGGTCTN